MTHTLMFAFPIAAAIGLAAAPSHAHGGVQVGVAVPPVVVDVAGVTVVVGQPAPPPPVVVYEQHAYYPPPRDVVVVRERHAHYPPPRDVVVVRERARDTVVYYEDGCDDRGNRGRWAKHGRGHGHGHGHGKVKHARGHRR